MRARPRRHGHRIRPLGRAGLTVVHHLNAAHASAKGEDAQQRHGLEDRRHVVIPCELGLQRTLSSRVRAFVQHDHVLRSCASNDVVKVHLGRVEGSPRRRRTPVGKGGALGKHTVGAEARREVGGAGPRGKRRPAVYEAGDDRRPARESPQALGCAHRLELRGFQPLQLAGHVDVERVERAARSGIGGGNRGQAGVGRHGVGRGPDGIEQVAILFEARSPIAALVQGATVATHTAADVRRWRSHGAFGLRWQHLALFGFSLRTLPALPRFLCALEREVEGLGARVAKDRFRAPAALAVEVAVQLAARMVAEGFARLGRELACRGGGSADKEHISF